MEAATPERLKDLVRMLVERVTMAQRGVALIEIVPAARPFFKSQPTLLVMAPLEGTPAPVGQRLDPLAWYALVDSPRCMAPPSMKARRGGRCNQRP
jgi:hypothetical protein